GKATYYDTGMGSCGQEHTDSELVVAISKEIMMKYDTGNPNNNPLCGKRIKCTRGGKEVIATVVDTCPGCTPDHVDLSRAAFGDLGDFAEGNISITWAWLDPIDE
ncbi:RlpA-like double-psi beta-barrel-protein domain-containing protein-containing protein, partial [Tricharina praecox]|uniref:RlpA-like double-psi beta-barrel-protein domain-containing protein-containing protein n=1 Tax=Tricharina praecox TaxID=43433 RepID=UPI002220AE5C